MSYIKMGLITFIAGSNSPPRSTSRTNSNWTSPTKTQPITVPTRVHGPTSRSLSTSLRRVTTSHPSPTSSSSSKSKLGNLNPPLLARCFSKKEESPRKSWNSSLQCLLLVTSNGSSRTSKSTSKSASKRRRSPTSGRRPIHSILQ